MAVSKYGPKHEDIGTRRTYQAVPYCVAINEYVLDLVGAIGHSVTPLAPSWLFVFFWWMPWKWIEELLGQSETSCTWHAKGASSHPLLAKLLITVMLILSPQSETPVSLSDSPLPTSQG